MMGVSLSGNECQTEPEAPAQAPWRLVGAAERDSCGRTGRLGNRRSGDEHRGILRAPTTGVCPSLQSLPACLYWQQVQSCSSPTPWQSLWQLLPYLASCFWGTETRSVAYKQRQVIRRECIEWQDTNHFRRCFGQLLQLLISYAFLCLDQSTVMQMIYLRV